MHDCSCRGKLCVPLIQEEVQKYLFPSQVPENDLLNLVDKKKPRKRLQPSASLNSVYSFSWPNHFIGIEHIVRNDCFSASTANDMMQFSTLHA